MKRIIIFALLTISFVCCECANAKSKPWPTPTGVLTKQEIIDKFFTNRQLDSIEGIWTTDDGNYEIAILKNTFDGNPEHDFVGVITYSKAKEWKSGQLKALFKKTANDQIYPGIWYMLDKQEENVSYRFASNTEIKYVLSGTLQEPPTPSSLIRVYPSAPDNTESNNNQRAISSGTGFAVFPDLVVTSYHVVGQRSSIQVTSVDGVVSKGTLVVKDLANDLAFIKVSGETTFSPIAIGKPCEVRSGSKVFTVGFPLPSELGNNAKVSEGIINSLTGLDDDPRMYQISIPIQPGNSGGPLLDAKGNVIGVVAATLNNKYLFFFKDTIAQNVNFAVKVNYIDNMISVLPGQPQLIQCKESGEMDAAQMLEFVRKSIVLVTARGM